MSLRFLLGECSLNRGEDCPRLDVDHSAGLRCLEEPDERFKEGRRHCFFWRAIVRSGKWV